MSDDTIVEAASLTEPQPSPENAEAPENAAAGGAAASGAAAGGAAAGGAAVDETADAAVDVNVPEDAPVDAPLDAPADVPALLEALLFASGKPVPAEKLAEVTELPAERIEEGLAALQAALEVPGRGVRLDRVAGGVRLVSRPEFDYPIRRLLGLDGRTKLSMAALETLAIVAYRQPVTAPEVAELRGVGSSSSIRTLLDRKLITTAGRKEVVGTPFLYKTTKEFLVHFGLTDTGELPKLEELDALYGVEAPAGPSAEQRELFPTDDVEMPAEADGSVAPAATAAGGEPTAPEEAPGGLEPAGEKPPGNDREEG